jgi:hypothetical protein
LGDRVKSAPSSITQSSKTAITQLPNHPITQFILSYVCSPR